MRVTFHYDAFNEAGHEQDIGIDTTFGEAIDRFCTEIGDEVFVLCAPRAVNN